MIKFSDPFVEKQVLALFLKDPKSFQKIPEDWFAFPLSKKCYTLFLSFLKSQQAVYPKSGDLVSSTKDNDLRLFILELEKIPIDFTPELKIRELYRMYATRRLIDELESVGVDLSKDNDIEAVIREKIQRLSQLIVPLSKPEKGFIFENVLERWEKFKQAEEGLIEETIPFCIEKLDQYTGGGLRKSHIVCFFAETGGYKTKVKANIAYNIAFIDKRPVMVVTLEVPKYEYELIIDSRHSLLGLNQIRQGQLPGSQRTQYKKSLEDIYKNRPPLYIVDIPDQCTPADIVRELEEYYVKFDYYPDVLVIDYVNEMEPLQGWNNTSEKFKNLGVELRRIARTYDIAIVTSMQANREAKKIRDKSKVGLEHISESHYFSNVCHLVVYLYQDDDGIDESMNVLNWAIKKNRYGKKNVIFQTFANPEINYIGDRQLILPQ